MRILAHDIHGRLGVCRGHLRAAGANALHGCLCGSVGAGISVTGCGIQRRSSAFIRGFNSASVTTSLLDHAPDSFRGAGQAVGGQADGVAYG